jgi:hypothetical protein
VAWDAILEVRREMKPYFLFPKDKTEATKELWRQTLSEYKEILKAKKVFAVAKTQRAFEMIYLLIIGDTKCTPRTPGSKLTEVPTRAFVLIPGRPSWTASSSTS